MELSIKEIENLASLSRLTLSEEEKKVMAKEFSSILGYVSELKEALPEAATGSSPELRNVMREDKVTNEPVVYSKVLLGEAPRSKDDYVEVTQVFNEED